MELLLEQYADLRQPLEEFLELESLFGGEQRAANSFALVSDTALREKYHFLSEGGRGGFSVVFKARDRELGRLVAVKVFKPDLGKTAALSRFLEGPQVASQLDHPGVAPIHEVRKTANGRPCVVMKWVDGETLTELLHRKRDRLSRARLLEIFKQVCQTIAYAHRKRSVLHRDLKPANIMVGPFGEVLVMDWGLSKVVHAGETDSAPEQSPMETRRGNHPDALTQAGMRMGTFAYMSPEQARGQTDPDHDGQRRVRPGRHPVRNIDGLSAALERGLRAVDRTSRAGWLGGQGRCNNASQGQPDSPS